ncbi:MAG: hypothetical protein IT383_20900 [Deltaproteobacteria bacterium]|nr:hypothetical protein [Deltaproteobacteria bacterium]
MLALDVESVNVSPDTARVVTQLVVAALSEVEGLEHTTQGDLRRLANLEAAKQAMDCSDASCLSEIADAMGARGVMFGSVTEVGASLSITLSLFDSRGAAMTRRTVDVRDLEEARVALRPAVREIVIEAGLVAPPAPPSASFTAGATLAAGGGVLLVGGGATAAVCELLLRDAGRPGPEKELLQGLGLLGVGVSAGGLVVGAVGGVLLGFGAAP